MNEQLRKLWQEYKEKVKAGQDPRTLYQKMIWPILLDFWKKSPVVEPQNFQFDVSIHTLGTSPEATTLAILGTRSSEVYVIHTPETRKYLEQIKRDVELELYPIEIEKNDVVTIYKKIKEVVERNIGKTVALDMTSGTKAMSAGMASGGFFFRRFFQNMRVVYVDNDEYDEELRRPVAGSEKLVILPSPHEVLGDVDAFFALEHYSKGEFYEAQRYFRETTKKTKDNRYDVLADICVMYHAWYSLDIETAFKKSRRIVEELQTDTWLNHPLGKYRGFFETQSKILEAIKRLLEEKDYTRNKFGVFALAKTLLKKSEKHEMHGETILTALCAYRALELLLQERLSLYNLTPDMSLTGEDKIAIKREMSKILQKPEDQVEIHDKLGLFEIAILLIVRKDVYLQEIFDQEKLKTLSLALQSRNSSLLIHGFDFPKENQVKYIKECARKLLKDLEIRARLRLDPSIDIYFEKAGLELFKM